MRGRTNAPQNNENVVANIRIVSFDFTPQNPSWTTGRAEAILPLVVFPNMAQLTADKISAIARSWNGGNFGGNIGQITSVVAVVWTCTGYNQTTGVASFSFPANQGGFGIGGHSGTGWQSASQIRVSAPVW